MPSQKNIDQLEMLTEKLSSAKAVVLADYSGLSVSQQQELRKKIMQSGGQFLVAKNTLFKLALRDTKHLGGGIQQKVKDKDDSSEVEKAIEDVLRGPTAFVFAEEDELGPIKTLIEFGRQHDAPKAKIGIILRPSEQILSVEQIEKLASLPSKEQLLAMLIGTLNAPRIRLVHVLSASMMKLTLVLTAISKQKESN